ncbi:MAG: CAP domain-containing protein [Cryomorphaceae bacterium]|nr:CAP domain-containing protein [Cryomorphaceae bacterium]
MSLLFRYLLCFLTAFSISISSKASVIEDTIYREGDLFSLMRGIKNDKLLQLERLTAFEFHQLINIYRQSKKLKTIYWDDKLWLAARNHSIYLIQNCKNLTHVETSSKPYFTGKEPSDRMNYVTYGSQEYAFGGFENCAVSAEMLPRTAIKLLPEELSWQEMVSFSRSTANEMFELWKHSPGHNSNMLESEHLAHGTSIVFGEHAQYTTSVFTQKQEFYSPDSLVLSFHDNWRNEFPERFTPKGHPFKEYPGGMGRGEYKIFQSFASLLQSRSCVPDKHLYELTKSENVLKLNGRQLKNKYLKYSNFSGFFKAMKYEFIPLVYSGSCSEEEFFTLKPVQALSDYFYVTPSLFSAIYWGGNLEIQRNADGEICFTLETISLIPKK